MRNTYETNHLALSNNHGTTDDTVVRYVDYSPERFNKTGFGKQTLIANPNYVLLVAQNNEHFENATVCTHHEVGALERRLAAERGRLVIECRNNAFYVTLPMKLNRGYNHELECEDVISYDLECMVSVQNYIQFLKSFPLSVNRRSVDEKMIGSEMGKAASHNLMKYADDKGMIPFERFQHLFECYGMKLHSVSKVENYKNTIAEIVKKKDDMVKYLDGMLEVIDKYLKIEEFNRLLCEPKKSASQTISVSKEAHVLPRQKTAQKSLPAPKKKAETVVSSGPASNNRASANNIGSQNNPYSSAPRVPQGNPYSSAPRIPQSNPYSSAPRTPQSSLSNNYISKRTGK